MPEIAAAIARREVKDAIVKFEAHLTRDQAAVFSVPEARRLLESAHFIASCNAILPDQRRGMLSVSRLQTKSCEMLRPRSVPSYRSDPPWFCHRSR